MKKFFKIFFLSIGGLILLFVGYFLIIRMQDQKAIDMQDFYVSSYKIKEPLLLPSLYIEGQRFYIKMPTEGDDTLMAFGDTGGGVSMILPGAIEKAGIQNDVKSGLVKAVMPINYVLFRSVFKNPHIPSPEPLRNIIIRHPFESVKAPFLIIPKIDDELKFMMKQMRFDIFLGQNFFMGKSWTFDYLKHQIWVNTPIKAAEKANPNVQTLGFKKDKNNKVVFGHPRFTIAIDSEKIDVLFDSGASIILSENGKKAFHTNAKTIGGSFIAASIFDKWRIEHPEWNYYKNADHSHDIIEVPKIKIGNYEVGPVLFAKRPDEVWSKGMIHSMDKVVKGAIGGSALQYFKVTIDYNAELIKFEI